MSVGPGCISRIELFTWFVQQGMEESAWLCDPITIVHFVILNGLSRIIRVWLPWFHANCEISVCNHLILTYCTNIWLSKYFKLVYHVKGNTNKVCN